MKNDSARLCRLRRKLYRQLPVASATRIASVDPRQSATSLKTVFAGGDRGVLGAGAAMALWSAATNKGYRAWCYDFGFADSLVHRVTIVAVGDRLQVHDPLFNHRYAGDFGEILDTLRDGRIPATVHEWRDRRVYVADPAAESAAALRWLEIHADRELAPAGGLRRFELLWNEEALGATRPAVAAARRELVARGYPDDLRFLMLHPVAMFDGATYHRDIATMPLIAGRDLYARFAALRVAERTLAAARDDNSRLAERLASLEAANHRAVVQRDAAERRCCEAEIRVAGVATAFEAKSAEAQRLDSQIIQMRAALDDAARQAQGTVTEAWLGLERREAAWTIERDALVEAAARASGDAAALRAEIAALRSRLDLAETARVALMADQQAALGEARREQADFIGAAGRLLDNDIPAEATPAAVLDRVHEKLLEARLARNRAEAERDRLLANPPEPPTPAPASGGLRRWIRNLMPRAVIGSPATHL